MGTDGTSAGGRKRMLGVIASLSLLGAGALGAIAILVGGGDSGRALMTAFLVFVLNGVVFIAFVHRHRSARIATWAAAGLACAASLLFTWVDDPAYSEEHPHGCADPIPRDGGAWHECPRTAYDWVRDFSFGFWFVVGCLVLLALFSLAWPFVRERRPLRLAYVSATLLGLLAALGFWLVAGLGGGGSPGEDMLLRASASAAILALVGAAVVIITAVTERTRRRRLPGGMPAPEGIERLVDARIEAFAQSPAFRDAVRRAMAEAREEGPESER